MAAPAEQVKHRTTTTRCRVSHSFCLTIFYWWICGVMYVFEWSHACWGWTDAGDGIPEHSKHISHWAHALFLCRINTLAPHNDRIHLWGWMKYIVVTKGADPESTKQQSRRNGRTFWRHIDWFSIKQRRYIFSWWLLGQKPLLYSLQLPLDIGREKNASMILFIKCVYLRKIGCRSGKSKIATPTFLIIVFHYYSECERCKLTSFCPLPTNIIFNWKYPKTIYC